MFFSKVIIRWKLPSISMISIIHEQSRWLEKIYSKQLTADKLRKPIFRTITSRDKSKSVPLGLITGEIRLYTSTTVAPSFNWLIFDGSAVSGKNYSRLLHVIGITYGAGDNQTTFNLPDLRGRFPLGYDAHRNRTDDVIRLGDTGGQTTHRMTSEHLPSHTLISINPTKNFNTIQLIKSTDDPATLYLIRGNNSDLLENGTIQAIQISSVTQKTFLNTVDEHTHDLKDTSGITGGGKEVSIINPYQIVYAG